jgi:hypothetical protein
MQFLKWNALGLHCSRSDGWFFTVHFLLGHTGNRESSTTHRYAKSLYNHPSVVLFIASVHLVKFGASLG